MGKSHGALKPKSSQGGFLASSLNCIMATGSNPTVWSVHVAFKAVKIIVIIIIFFLPLSQGGSFNYRITKITKLNNTSLIMGKLRFRDLLSLTTKREIDK